MTTNALVFGSPLNFICVCIKFYLCLCVCIYAGVRVCVGVRPHDLPAYADSTLKHYHAIFQIHQGADPVGCGQQCRWEICHCGVWTTVPMGNMTLRASTIWYGNANATEWYLCLCGKRLLALRVDNTHQNRLRHHWLNSFLLLLKKHKHSRATIKTTVK